MGVGLSWKQILDEEISGSVNDDEYSYWEMAISACNAPRSSSTPTSPLVRPPSRAAKEATMSENSALLINNIYGPQSGGSMSSENHPIS